MHCPHCGAESVDQSFCGNCGQILAEFSQLLAEKPTRRDELKIQKRKAQRLSLTLWTGAGIVFYIVLYWIIISEIIIRKGHKEAGILFLVVITAISVGGLLVLYSAALAKRSAYRVSDPRGDKPNTPCSQTLELRTSDTEPTPELLEKDVPNGK